MFDLMSLFGGGNSNTTQPATTPGVFDNMGPPAPMDLTKIVEPTVALASQEDEAMKQLMAKAYQDYVARERAGMYAAPMMSPVSHQGQFRQSAISPQQNYGNYSSGMGRPFGLMA